MNHTQVWNAIDKIAKSKNLSVSGLARKAGLDATTFNRSKRVTETGKKRWPTTESLAKVLNSNDMTLNDFVKFVNEDSLAEVMKRNY